MLTPLLIYGKNKEYDINDAFYLISSILLLGIAFRYLLVYRNMSIHYIFYLLMITIMTDTFAHFFGSKLGKNKLCPYVSPNKTIEGLSVNESNSMTMTIPLSQRAINIAKR